MKWDDLRREARQTKNIVFASGLIIGLMLVKWHLSSRPAVNIVDLKHEDSHTSTIESSGQIRAGLESFLTLRTGGRLDEIKLNQGDPVKKGDIILMVDVATNRAGLERALSRYRFAAAENSRNRNLLAAAAGTRQAFEETQNELTVTRSDLEQARQKLEDSIIRAPSDGVVTLIAFKVGDFIPDGSRVAIVEDHSSYEITTRIPIEREGELPKNANVSLIPMKHSGSKSARRVQVDIESMAALASMVSQDFDARLRFTSIPEGMNVKDQVKVIIPMQTFHNVDVVKLQSVFDIQTVPRVLTLDERDLPRWAPVEILDIVQDNVYIKNLAKDLRVVTPVEGTQPLKIIGKRVVIRSAGDDKGRRS